MKKFILAATFAIAGLTAAQASEVKDLKTTAIVAVQDSVTKTPVKLEELPDAVKTTLASESYKVWTPTEAWLVKDGSAEYYLINVKKEQETGSIKLDKDGKPVQ